MIVFYACDLFGDEQQYLKSYSIIKHLRPAISIFNSNLLVKKNSDQKLDIDKILKIWGEISKISTLLIQFGGYDSIENNTIIQKYISGSNIFNITNGIYTTPHYDFRAFSFMPPIFVESNWRAKDGLLHREQCEFNGEIIIRQLISECDFSKTIFISSIPPLGILDYDPNPLYNGSYLIRKFCEGDLSNNIQPICILCGGFPFNFYHTQTWYEKIENCLCLQPGQSEIRLMYNIVDISQQSEIKFFHPWSATNELRRDLNYETID